MKDNPWWGTVLIGKTCAAHHVALSSFWDKGATVAHIALIAHLGQICADELSCIAQALIICAHELPPIAQVGKYVQMSYRL